MLLACGFMYTHSHCIVKQVLSSLLNQMLALNMNDQHAYMFHIYNFSYLEVHLLTHMVLIQLDSRVKVFLRYQIIDGSWQLVCILLSSAREYCFLFCQFVAYCKHIWESIPCENSLFFWREKTFIWKKWNKTFEEWMELQLQQHPGCISSTLISIFILLFIW